MPIGEDRLVPGRVYVTDRYQFVQVIAVDTGGVVYRQRRQSPLMRFVPTVRFMTLAKFAASVRAEVNGEFFPTFADLRGYSFRPPEQARSALRQHLAEHAPHRPFVTCHSHAGSPADGVGEDLSTSLTPSREFGDTRTTSDGGGTA